MEIKELITAIEQKNHEQGITVYFPAKEKDILDFERNIGFPLPPEFKEFYFICNGFACNEDIFNFLPLHEISDRGKNWFAFAEYMIYSDIWGLRITEDLRFEIFNGDYELPAMTSSLKEFLNHYLQGNVFGKGGLYDWMKELEIGKE